MSEIEEQMQPLFNDGLRQRIIALVKVGPDETWIYALCMPFYPFIQWIALDIFKENDHGEVKAMPCKLRPSSNYGSELALELRFKFNIFKTCKIVYKGRGRDFALS